jgi:heat shock protein HtpX
MTDLFLLFACVVFVVVFTWLEKKFNSQMESLLSLAEFVYVWIVRIIVTIIIIAMFFYVLFFQAIMLLKIGLASLVLALIIFIFFVGLYPADFAYKLFRLFSSFSASRRITGFWQLYNSNKLRRLIVIILLFAANLSLVVGNIYLFNLFGKKVTGNYLSNTILASLLYILLLVFIFLLDFFRHRNLPSAVDHGRQRELYNIVQNLSITAGIEMPTIRIISAQTATAFVVSNNIKKSYTLVVSVGLLNVMDANELEAVVAHELSHIVAGQTIDYYYLALLLSFLKSTGGGFVILIMSAFHPWLFYVWLIVFILLAAESHNQSSPYIIDKESVLYSVFIFFMPSYSIINFIGCLIYYALSTNEDLLADLQAILLTRYPAGLFKALVKIEELPPTNSIEFGTKLNYLYFAGENIYYSIPQPQPSLSLRKKMLTEVDRTLQDLKIVDQVKILSCPLCQTNMTKLRADSHYIKQNVELDKCDNCGSIWFDQFELYYIANLALLGAPQSKAKLQIDELKKDVNCPRCGIKLVRDNSINIPKSINIWRCRSCQGCFLYQEDIIEYAEMISENNKIIQN